MRDEAAVNDETFRMLQDRLGTFRDKQDKIVKPEKPWHPLRASDLLAEKRVQSFDQTLTNCGMVRIVVEESNHDVWVLDKEVLKPPRFPELSTFAENYERAHWLRNELIGLMYPHETVLEMPPVHGFQTQSILLAGDAIWDVAREMDAPVSLISKNHVGAVLCNDKSASKAQIKEALAAFIPDVTTRDWNEHTRDAAAQAIVRLYDMKQEGVSG
jgi:hypothetical protein